MRIGDSTVETLVMVTDRATSPFDMKVITLEEVPPGQVPTRTTPVVSAGSRLKAMDRPKARNGMIKYCAQTPMRISTGRFKTSAKSLRFSVVPMPNITTPSRQLSTLMPPTLPSTHRKLWGIVRPRARKTMAMMPKNLPIKAQNCFI